MAKKAVRAVGMATRVTQDNTIRQVAEVGLVVEGLAGAPRGGVTIAKVVSELARKDRVGTWSNRAANRMGLVPTARKATTEARGRGC